MPKDTSGPMFPQPATYHEGAEEGERKFTPEMKLSGITYRQFLVGLFVKALLKPGCKKDVVLLLAHEYADAVIAYQENEADQI